MKNEMNELGLSAEQRTQAMLCAYVLGELEGEERAEIEKALEQSEALRAEKAKLEATIGVVAGALQSGAGDALSAEATAKLVSAAARRARPVWYRSRAFTGFAVSAGVVTVASIALMNSMNERTAQRAPTLSRAESDGLTVARLDQPSQPTAPATEEITRDQWGLADKEAERAAASAETTVASTESKREGTQPAQDGSSSAVTPQLQKAREVTGADIEALENEKLVLTQTVQDEKGQVPTNSRLDAVQKQEAEKKLAELQGQLAAGSKDSVDREVDLFTPAEPSADPSAATAGGSSIGVGAPGKSGTGQPSAYVSRRAGSGGKGYAGKNAPSAPAPGPATAGAGGPSVPASKVTTLPPPASGYRGAGESVPADKGETAHAAPEESAPVAGKLKSDEVTGADLDDATKNRFEEQRKSRQSVGDVTGSDDYFLGRGNPLDEQLARRQEALRRYQLLEQSCRYRPNERPRDMFFRFWGDNPFELAALDKLSTFSADVDTASYALARNYLVRGYLPTKEQVRTEEFINYFKGDVPPPTEGTFNVALELAPSLFGDTTDTWMLRVALRGKEIAKEQRMPLTLTFVVDVSGSMREENRLELVKHALRLLVAQLDARDTISIVTFSDNANLVLPPTSAKQKDLIESAIHPLTPQNSTNTEAGLRMGYAQAVASLTQGASNRVVLLTDGVANVGLTDPNALVAMVDLQRKQGILLNTVGVGMDNHNDNLLEQLADKGDGLCNYVDDEQEVRRALVDNFTGALIPIARDVKIQVEFDPAQVERYRLLGYENRAVADADFRNDKVDAGEIGSGHQVVALYEIVRRNAPDPTAALATVRVRYKDPYLQGVADKNEEAPAHEIERSIQARQSVGAYAQASAGYRRSVLVAQFAEFLRRSIHARNDSLDRMIDESGKLSAELKDKEFDEFLDMAKKSRDLVLAELHRRDWFDDCSDLIRHNCYLRQQVDELSRRFGSDRKLDELQRQMGDLQRRLDELRRRLEDAKYPLDPDLIPRLQQENLELQRQVIELLERLRTEGK